MKGFRPAPLHETVESPPDHEGWIVQSHDRTRPPAGTEIDLVLLRLVQLVHLEDVNELHRRLEKDFRPRIRDFADPIRTSHDSSLLTTGWRSIGFIVPPQSQRSFASEPVQIATSMPAGIDYVHVVLHKVLPSISLLAFDVHLSPLLTTELVALQAIKYSPHVHLTRGPNRIRRRRVRTWTEQPDMVRTRQVLSRLADLKTKTVAMLAPIIEPSRRLPNDPAGDLPAIEVFTIRRSLTEEETSSDWLQASRSWWESLGFNFNIESYGTDEVMFLLGHPRFSLLSGASFNPGSVADRMVIWHNPTMQERAEHGYGGDVRHYQTSLAKGFLDHLLPSWAVARLLDVVRRDLESIRGSVFSIMTSRGSMKDLHRFEDTVRRRHILISRLQLEYEDKKPYFLPDLDRFAEWHERGLWRIRGTPHSVRAAIAELIESRLCLVRDHLDLLVSSFQEYVATQNARLLHQANGRMFWLTLIVGLFALLGLIADWDKYGALWKRLLDP